MQNRWFGRGGTVRYLPSSPDLTPVNFFVGLVLKGKVCNRKPETTTKMRVATEKECAQISEETLLNVSRVISSRYKKRIKQYGSQFEYLCELINA